jgi:hypothetical protein
MIEMPAAFSFGQNSIALLPAVSTIFTPLPMIASMYASYGGGVMAGKMVMLTANGASVMELQRSISRTRASGVG